MDILPSSQMHGPSDDEADPCQSTPKPTPIATAKTTNVTTIMAKAIGCSLIAAPKLKRVQRPSHFIDLDWADVC